MAWPTTAIFPQPGANAPFIRRGVDRAFGNRAVPDSDVAYDDGYSTGYSDGFTAGGGSAPSSGQLWPRREG